MGSRITVDGAEHEVRRARMTWNRSDWTLELTALDDRALLLEGVTDGDRLRIDLRSLDALLEDLLGYPICAYPGGQLHNAAHLTVRSEDGKMRLSTSFEFDWDRAIDPPGASYPSPRTFSMEVTVTG